MIFYLEGILEKTKQDVNFIEKIDPVIFFIL